MRFTTNRGFAMLSKEEIIVAIKDRNVIKVARATGLHPNTIYNVKSGKQCSYKTAEILTEYLLTRS